MSNKRLKCWKKGVHDSYHRTDGVEIVSYGTLTIYPFIQISKFYNPKTGTTDGYEIMKHGLHTSESLGKKETKPKAWAFAQKYMKEHDSC